MYFTMRFFLYLYIKIVKMECLDKLIGISQRDCNCPAIKGGKESKSGYYFDESAYSFDLQQWVDVVGCEDVEDTINGFISNAKEILVREFSIKMNEGLNYKREPINVNFGELTGRKVSLKAGDEIVFLIQSKSRGAGAKMILEEFDFDEDYFQVTIAEREVENGKRAEVEIIVDVLQDVEMIDTKNSCSTCSSSIRKNKGISVTSYLNGNVKSRQMFGFNFDVSIKCSYRDVLCRALEDKEVEQTVGLILQKIAVREGLKYIVNSNDFDRYTVINTDIRTDNIHKLKAEYMRDIEEWLIPTLRIEDSFCFGCKNKKSRISKSWF